MSGEAVPLERISKYAWTIPQEYKGGDAGRVDADDELIEKIKSDHTTRGI